MESNYFLIEYTKKFPFIKISKSNLFSAFIISLIIGIVGFLYETLISYLYYDVIIDRGFLIGPFLPIYFFSVFILCILVKIPKLSILNFLFSILLIGGFISLIEFITGNIFEIAIGKELWNYNEVYILSYKYVSVITGFSWGILGSFLMYFVIPYLKNKVDKIPTVFRKPIVITFIILLIVDIIISFYLVYVNEGYSNLYEIKCDKRFSKIVILFILCLLLGKFLYKVIKTRFNKLNNVFTYLFWILFIGLTIAFSFYFYNELEF